ncbi:unnamed protein product, partial [Protopolystoma xenopodis]
MPKLLSIGYGLIYLPSVTILTSWFQAKRATATGLVMAGSGVGGIIYALLLPRLLESFTWRGSIFLLSAVNLNCIVTACLFRPVPEEADVDFAAYNAAK